MTTKAPLRIERVGWALDPEDPRTPTVDQWTRMTPEERTLVLDALPDERTLLAPEGDQHSEPQRVAIETLRAHFGRRGQSVYVAGGLAIYYPGERPFAPDLLAVLDVPTHRRTAWVVADEGKGLDLALEIHWKGDWRKDSIDNVARYARLGIREYFLFDVRRERLAGWRLPPEEREYQPLPAKLGRFSSEILGLEIWVEQGLLRFGAVNAPLLSPTELAARLEGLLAETQAHAAAEIERLQEFELLAEQEKARAEQEKARADALAAELEKLRRGS